MKFFSGPHESASILAVLPMCHIGNVSIKLGGEVVPIRSGHEREPLTPVFGRFRERPQLLGQCRITRPPCQWQPGKFIDQANRLMRDLIFEEVSEHRQQVWVGSIREQLIGESPIELAQTGGRIRQRC